MEAQASQTSAHHFWAFFRGPRHKFCAAAWLKGYRVRKDVLHLETQVLVACYFLQPYFIDLAIWIRHFPKIATFFGGVQETHRSQLSHFENSWKPKPPKVPRTIFGPFSGSQSQVLCGRSAERLPRP